jgi:two-component system nitrogen regulation response regulator GlnG/two-component system response regulator HydG
MPVAQDATLPPSTLSAEGLPDPADEILALVVLWSRHEPQRVGEALLVPGDGAAEPWVLGRGDAAGEERRLALVRQRPGGIEPTGPIESPRISRVQLRVRAEDGLLAIENAGRCPAVLGGREIERGTLAPGDALEIKNELLLLCAARPARLAGPRPPRRAHPFGERDAHGLVGESPAAWRLRAVIAEAARHPAHALVIGPSGSGKELVARALHAEGPRSGRPFVARNAVTIPESLVDAELFGNARGYPNPGMPERPGLVGQANGGTLFLDEFAELPASLQAHLLRVLDDGEYQRLGEASARRSDFRLIAATNRPEAHVKHDVLARLKIRVATPGLDERREDVPLLAAHLLRGHAVADPSIAERFFPDGSPDAWPRLAPALVGALVRHRYTTHVRELDALLLLAVRESASRYVELTEGVRRALETRVDAAPEAAAPASSRPVSSAPGSSRPASSRPVFAAPGSSWPASSRPVFAAPAPAPPAFTQEEQRRLDLQRGHRFRAIECGRDPAYPGNRQTADLHLRLLACKALRAAAWDVDAAAALLAGDGDADLHGRARARIDTFLSNIERRIEEARGLAPSEDAKRSLLDEWRGAAEALTPVLDALEKGLIRGRSAPGRGAG